MNEPFHHKLRSARTLLAQSQAQVARGSGVTQPDLSELESKDKNVIPLRYLVFLHKCGIDLNTLFTDGPVRTQLQMQRCAPITSTLEDTGELARLKELHFKLIEKLLA